MMIWEGSWFQRRSAGHCGSVKEIRLEIFTDRGRRDHLKKIFPHRGTVRICGAVCGKPGADTGCLVCICDMDQVVAAAGSGKKELTDKYISSQLMKLLGERTATTFPGQEKASVKIVSEQEGDYLWEVIHPIICEGDVIGGVILLSRDEKKEVYRSGAEGGKLCGRLFRPSDGAVEKGGKQKSGNKSQYTVITCDRQGGTADGKTDSKRYKEFCGC